MSNTIQRERSGLKTSCTTDQQGDEKASQTGGIDVAAGREEVEERGELGGGGEGVEEAVQEQEGGAEEAGAEGGREVGGAQEQAHGQVGGEDGALADVCRDEDLHVTGILH